MHLQVTDTQTRAIVAVTHSATYTWPQRYLRLELIAELMPFLDAFVLAFVICEKKRRYRARGRWHAAA